MIIKQRRCIGLCIMNIVLLAITAICLFVRSSCTETIVQLELVCRDDCEKEFQRMSFGKNEEYITLCLKAGVSEWLRDEVVRKCRDNDFFHGCDSVALTNLVFESSIGFDKLNDVIDVKVVARSEDTANSLARCYAETLVDWSWRYNRDHLLKSATQIRRSADRKLGVIRKAELKSMQDEYGAQGGGASNIKEKLKLAREGCANMCIDADRLERQAALPCVGMGLRIVNN